ncbi:MAG TPA: Gfo/Idh/MocA family oxidoreductase [Actinomycetes bacterium]|nr:Gfo/Idh/MocA family oxidoreductase [Actinomycetes bacterium]
MTAAPVRWGFLAAGYIATRALAPAVHRAAGAELYAVAARDQHRAEALQPRRVHSTYRDVLDDPDVDAVYISLTNEAHLPWITASLEAGKHVLCEKPLTMSAAECEAAFGCAERERRLLVEAGWMRWHPRYRRAAELLGSAASGAAQEIGATFTFDGVPEDNYRKHRSLGGGALLDLGAYVLAPVIDWCGPSRWSINARQTVNDRGADLRTDATLNSGNTTARITTSIVDPEQQALTVAAAGVTLTWGPDAFTSWRAASTLTVADETTQTVEEFAPCDAYQLMVEDVSRRVKDGETVRAPERDASLRTALLIDQIASAASVAA